MKYSIKLVFASASILFAVTSLFGGTLKETSYSTDDLHLPYPLVFVHGYTMHTGPNTNITRDLGVQSGGSPFIAEYTLKGFNRHGFAPKEKDISMDVAFPSDDVQLADPAAWGIRGLARHCKHHESREDGS